MPWFVPRAPARLTLGIAKSSQSVTLQAPARLTLRQPRSCITCSIRQVEKAGGIPMQASQMQGLRNSPRREASSAFVPNAWPTFTPGNSRWMNREFESLLIRWFFACSRLPKNCRPSVYKCAWQGLAISRSAVSPVQLPSTGPLSSQPSRW